MDQLPAFLVYLPSPPRFKCFDLVSIGPLFGASGYKLALRTPGNSPASANCRKQIRQSPVCLM